MRKSTAAILVGPTQFEIFEQGHRSAAIAFGEISEITFYKHDEMTTDLICCDIVVGHEPTVTVFTVHEEMPGFDDLLSRLEQLPGFRKDWREVLVLPPFAADHTVVFQQR